MPGTNKVKKAEVGSFWLVLNFVVSLFLVLLLGKFLLVTVCISEFVKLILFVHKKTLSCLAMLNT